MRLTYDLKYWYWAWVVRAWVVRAGVVGVVRVVRARVVRVVRQIPVIRKEGRGAVVEAWRDLEQSFSSLLPVQVVSGQSAAARNLSFVFSLQVNTELRCSVISDTSQCQWGEAVGNAHQQYGWVDSILQWQESNHSWPVTLEYWRVTVVSWKKSYYWSYQQLIYDVKLIKFTVNITVHHSSHNYMDIAEICSVYPYETVYH